MILNGNGEKPPLVVSILVPAHDMCATMFAYDLANLNSYTIANITELGDTVTVGLTFCPGTYVHAARWDLLLAALEQGAHYICWIDSDMRFPRDALMRLIKRDVDVVGINYCTRGLPPRYVAIKEVGRVGSNLETTEASTGLEEVDAMGFGLVLMKTRPLLNLPRDGKPWFWFEWMEERKNMMGEDVYFFKLMREAGVKLYIDHDLSKECRHIGSFEYGLHHVEAWREVDADKPPTEEEVAKLVVVP